MNNQVREYLKSKCGIISVNTDKISDDELDIFVKSIEDNSDKLELKIINDLICYQNVLEGQGMDLDELVAIELPFINFLNNDDEVKRGILSSNTSKEMDLINAYKEKRDSNDSKIVIYTYTDSEGKKESKPAILDLKKWRTDGINISVEKENIKVDLETIQNFLDINEIRKREIISKFDALCTYYAEYVYFMIYRLFLTEYMSFKNMGVDSNSDPKMLKVYIDIENQENSKAYLTNEEIEKLRRYKFYSSKEVYYVNPKISAMPIHLDNLKKLFIEDQCVSLERKGNTIEAQIEFSKFESLLMNTNEKKI